MTPEELAARLAHVRIPESFARFGIQDALAACALGLIAALLISSLLRLVTVRRNNPLVEARSAIERLAGLEKQARITGLAALLREKGGTAPDGLDEALYNPNAALDPAKVEAAVVATARKGLRR
ncbi:hypothetical protein [Algicella marina]|uniref:Uncharacterized protein n=1 Tax=Algicella marina TaxID=2683284 RepID=A0A6P1T4A0_9RHOB|nr:hypothetical protein [Algicella marina]QHQ35362.1 hypothetical protein GO499_09220 [Algicella marina]